MNKKYIYEYRCMSGSHEVVIIFNRIVKELTDRYIIINEHGVQTSLYKDSIKRNPDRYYLERDDKKAVKAMFERSENNRAFYNNARIKEIAERNRDFDEEQTSLRKVFDGEIAITEKKYNDKLN